MKRLLKGPNTSWNLFLVCLLAAECAVFGAANPKFLSLARIFTSANSDLPIWYISIFVTFVMITGGIDIQSCAIVGLTSIIIGVAWQDFGLNIWAAALLAVVVGLACLGLAVTGAMAPMAVLPKLDLPLMLGLSAIALALDAYTGRPGLSWPGLLVNTVLGGAVFALLPWCAGLPAGVPLWTLGLAGAAVFGLSALLYTAALERIATGPKAPLAPAGTAFMLYLAGQCLSGLL